MSPTDREVRRLQLDTSVSVYVEFMHSCRAEHKHPSITCEPQCGLQTTPTCFQGARIRHILAKIWLVSPIRWCHADSVKYSLIQFSLLLPTDDAMLAVWNTALLNLACFSQQMIPCGQCEVQSYSIWFASPNRWWPCGQCDVESHSIVPKLMFVKVNNLKTQKAQKNTSEFRGEIFVWRKNNVRPGKGNCHRQWRCSSKVLKNITKEII
jgi:hypothetical protein